MIFTAGFRNVVTLISALFVLTGCVSSMIDSIQLPPEALMPACVNSAGSYSLPRRALPLVISTDETTPGLFRLDFDPTKLVSMADRQAPTFCLDYVASPTAVDTVGISRTADGLLKVVSTDANDKSLEIATALIDIARLSAVAAAARANNILTSDGKLLVAQYDLDPFDVPEASAINDALRDFGYCVFVAGATFPESVTPEQYCQHPRAALASAHQPFVTKAPQIDPRMRQVLIDESRHGILYRPNEVHEITVLYKPKGGKQWRRLNSIPVEMPNVAPIFSIGVDRTLFTTRTTTLKFDDGVLKDVALKKGSEVDSISQIPLKIAQAIVAVPTEIVQFRVSNVNNERALINAQAQLLETYRSYQQARGAVVASSAVAGSQSAGPTQSQDLIARCSGKDSVTDIRSCFSEANQ